MADIGGGRGRLDDLPVGSRARLALGLRCRRRPPRGQAALTAGDAIFVPDLVIDPRADPGLAERHRRVRDPGVQLQMLAPAFEVRVDLGERQQRVRGRVGLVVVLGRAG